jgi:hypothetical protein
VPGKIPVALQGRGCHFSGGILHDPLVEELSNGPWVGLNERALVHLSHDTPEFVVGIALAPESTLEYSPALSVLVFPYVDPQAPINAARGQLAFVRRPLHRSSFPAGRLRLRTGDPRRRGSPQFARRHITGTSESRPKQQVRGRSRGRD